MTSPRARLLAVAEAVASYMTDAQCEIAIRCLYRLAGEGRRVAADVERSRADREIGETRTT